MENNDLDFIGKLPDCVLLHILSLLHYKEAARTAVLSNRWRHVLPSLNIVGFDDALLGLESGFVEFTRDLVKNYQEPFMDKFSLSLSVSSPRDLAGEVQSCIAFAVEKKAKVMLLDFSNHNREEARFDLPMDVNRHKTLETLKLFSCTFAASEFKNFDSLLHLSFGWIELSSVSLKSVVENCTSLKSLSLKKCTISDIIEVKGHNDLRLDSLVIDDCNVVHDWISIKTPNLKIFKYSGKFCNLELDSMRRLEEAVLDFGVESESREVGDLLYQLFRDLYAVKILTICSYVLQIIPSGEEPLGLNPRLKLMKHLILKTTMHENEFYGIRFFLNSCPTLVTLTIEVDPSRKIFEEYESPFEENWARAMPVYSCVRRTLKVVDVKGFRGNRDEINLLAYFVHSGCAMETLNVRVDEDSDISSLQKARILQNVKKASPNLQISIIPSINMQNMLICNNKDSAS